jgi:general secretion pathway protein B
MSYILDALLKADQERQRNATPSLRSVHAPHIVEPPGSSKRWTYPVLLTLLGGGLLVCGVLLGMKTLERTPLAKVATSGPSAPRMQRDNNNVTPLRPEPAGLTAVVPAKAATDRVRAPSPTALPAPPPTTVAAISRERTPPRARHGAAFAAPPPLPSSTGTETEPPAAHMATTGPADQVKHSNRIVGLGELPPELRKEVAESVNVSGFSFSADNDEGMVIINDRVRRAGDEIATGMKLETILPDGIILNYKGYRFRTGMY